VWVLDIGVNGTLHPPVATGYDFLGSAAPDLPGHASPQANAVLLRGDIAYVADVWSGLHVLRVNATAPAP
jgi:hypothetical protein